MGYGKWRKILTILMIISICFTLFSKFSKVFATVDTTPHNTLIFGTYYDLYYDYITSNYNYFVLSAVQQYQGNTSNPTGYNRLYLYCSDSPIIFYENTIHYEDNTYLTNTTFNPTNDATIDFYIADYTTTYSNRFSYYNTVANFNNCPFDPNSNNNYDVFNSPSYMGFQRKNRTFTPLFQNGDYDNNYFKDEYNILSSNYDLKDSDGNIIFYGSNRRAPELTTPLTDLENLTFDGLSINSWGYSDIDFYLLIYDRTLIGTDYNYVIEPATEILLNPNSSYFQPLLSADTSTNCVYWIPITDIGLQFSKDGIYEIRFGIRRWNDSGGAGGGGFRGDDIDNSNIDYNELYQGGNGAFGGYAPQYYYENIGLNYVWEIDSSVTQAKIDEINSKIRLSEEQRRHYEQDKINSESDLYIYSGIFRDNNTDITSSGFEGIFTRFYNNVNATPQSVSLIIPFTDTPMTIDPNITYNALGDNNIILTLWESFIFFLVSLYIVKDLQHIIELIKSGDITTHTDTNIKANML